MVRLRNTGESRSPTRPAACAPTRWSAAGTSPASAIAATPDRRPLVPSLDIPFTEVDGRTNLQVFQRIYLDGGDGAVALKSGSIGVSAYVSANLAGAWEPQLLWIQTSCSIREDDSGRRLFAV